MFKDLSPEENDQRTRMLLEHELRAAIRIIGYLIEQQGASVTLPHRVLGTRYALTVTTNSVLNEIVVAAKREIDPVKS